MKQLKKILFNPWVIAIFTPIIGSTLAAVIKKMNLLEAFKWLCSTVFNFVFFIISYKIPIYVIILSIGVVFIIAKFYYNLKTTKAANEPKWLRYKKNSYKQWIFGWEYHLDYGNEYQIKNLRPICKCACELTMKNRLGNRYFSNGILLCPKCGNNYPLLEEDTLEDFLKILQHDIKTGQYTENNIG